MLRILLFTTATLFFQNQASADSLSLSARVKKIYAGPHLSSCDSKNENIALELAEFIDAHPIPPPSSGTISGSSAALNLTGDLRSFGTSYLDFSRPTQSHAGVTGFSYGWKRASAFLQSLRHPITRNDLITLFQSVTNILSDDRRRLSHSVNYGIDRSLEPHLLQIRATLERCFLNKKCLNPEFSAAELKFVRKIQKYREWNETLISNAPSVGQEEMDSTQRKWIEIFYTQTIKDTNRFQENISSPLEGDEGGNNLILWYPVDLSQFSNLDRRTIHELIESVWKTDGISIKLRETTLDRDPGAVKFIFHPTLYEGRDFGSPREIHFYPFSSAWAVAHEFGHAIGFDDHYFTVWDEKNCEYRTGGDDRDLMAHHLTGAVTETEWNMLRRYQKKH